MPLPAPDPDEVMPKDLQTMAGYMRKCYVPADEWWSPLTVQDQEEDLPDDLRSDTSPLGQTEPANS